MNNKPKFKKTNCDFCGSNKFLKLYSAKDHYNHLPGEFTLVKCANCGLVYTNPRPIKKDLGYFYPDSAGYFIPSINKEDKGIKKRMKNAILKEYYGYFTEIKKNIFIKMTLFPFYLWKYGDFKISGFPNFIKNGKLLDIGCLYGGFLFEMKKLGWQVKGIELNKKAAEWGKINFGLEILYTDIDNFKTNEKFDVITMRMLLEHVYSPKKVLKKVKSLLKPNGVLIISIPNFNGFEAKLYGRYAYTLHVPNHLTHFTPLTIKQYLKSSGFKNVKIYHQKVDRDLIAPLTHLESEGKKVKILRKIMINKVIRKTLVKGIVNILSYMDKTSRMTIYASK
jgi:2-polyprenyl-3-methyl-5-hydroxy-6-metoxy-1,4-benzoquinol methylase